MFASTYVKILVLQVRAVIDTAHIDESAKNPCRLLGLGSIGKTSSARESLTIDTHHLTSSDELDTLPPNPTSFEPLPNSLVPQKNSQEPTLCFYFSKKCGAKAAAIDTIARVSAWKSVVRATLCILHGAGPAPTTLFQALTRAT